MTVIYLNSMTRDLFLRKHAFFVKEVKARVLSQFVDVEREAEEFMNQEYLRLGSRVGSGDVDMSHIADAASGNAEEFYALLYTMKMQLSLASLAALYHQWDKEFRDFMERELARGYDTKKIYELCWHPNIGHLFDVLKQLGWDVRNESFYRKMDACRLVVNVYKHGKGNSLDQLTAKYPIYLKTPFSDMPEAPEFLKIPRYDDLKLSAEEFEDIADAFNSFWMAFPERLYASRSL